MTPHDDPRLPPFSSRRRPALPCLAWSPPILVGRCLLNLVRDKYLLLNVVQAGYRLFDLIQATGPAAVSSTLSGPAAAPLI